MKPLLLVAALAVLPLCVKAQINRPRTNSAATTSAPASAPASTRQVESAPASTDGFLVTTESSGFEIKLIKVEGNATNQQVTLSMLFTNPKANANAAIGHAYAVDPEGDEYNNVENNSNFTLYTDVPRKGYRTLNGVPSKVKTLRFAKFDFWNQSTGDWKAVEFRNLKIDWK